MFSNYKEVAQLLHKALGENRPLLKMKILNDNQSPLLRVILSLARWEMFVTPKPRWTTTTEAEMTSSECSKALEQLLTSGEIDANTFYTYPLQVQQVLHYSSTYKFIGLNPAQLVSTTDLLSIDDIATEVGIAIKPQEVNTCPKCGQPSDSICKRCILSLINSINFRGQDFTLYGTAIRDFQVQLRDWDIVVTKGEYKFTRLENTTESYQPALPFEEYQDNVSVL